MSDLTCSVSGAVPPNGAVGRLANATFRRAGGVRRPRADASAPPGQHLQFPAKISTFTHTAYPGFPPKLDRQFAKEEGWYTGVFSVKAQR